MLEYIAGGAALLIIARISARVYRKHLRPKIKGYLGELGVRRTLSKLSDSSSETLKDLLLHTGRDTTQIDHVLVSRYGVFDIETKNLSGLICGNEWDREWQQITNRGVYPIPNPVRQNYKHTLALKHTLKDFPDVPVYPIVVFSNKSKLDVSSERTLVVNQKDLLSAIGSLSLTPVLSEAQVQQIKDCLEGANITDRQKRKQHLAQAQLRKELFFADEVSKAYEEGKNSPVIHFTPQLTQEERFLQEELDAFHEHGPVLTIKGITDTIDGFLKNARRNADGTLASDSSRFDHLICPFTGTAFPPSEASNLERGLWLSYLNKHPVLAHHASTKDGFSELFPSSTRGSAIISAYLKAPASFTAKAKNNAWYRNLENSFQKPTVERQIADASQKREACSPPTSPELERCSTLCCQSDRE